MKKVLKIVIITMILSFLILNCFIKQKTLAVTVPELSITSTKYSVGDKVKEDNSDINEVEVGKTLQLYAIISHGNDMVIDGDPDSLGWFVDKTVENSATWTSSNTTVATVDNTGKVTGKAEGTTTITVECPEETSANNTSATYQLSVKKSSEPVSDDFKFGDFSKATVKIQTNTDEFKTHYLQVSGATFLSNNEYYILVSHKEENISENIDNSQKNLTDNLGFDFLNRNEPKLNVTKLCEEAGDICYTIVEVSKNENFDRKLKVVKTGKAARVSLNSVGSRMKCYFFSDYTSTFLYEFGQNENRKIKLKIGRVTDNNVLINIRDGKSGALQNLMSYAKSNATPVYTGSVPVGRSNSITSNINIEDDAYYYVYMQLDDENGKYYPVEDVSLYQGLVSSSVGKNLFDYLSNEFKWNLENGGGNTVINNDPTIAKGKLPYAGSIALGGISVTTIIVMLFLIKKNKDYKDVK